MYTRGAGGRKKWNKVSGAQSIPNPVTAKYDEFDVDDAQDRNPFERLGWNERCG